MKKILAILLALSVIVCFAACGGNTTENTTTAENPTDDGTAEDVAFTGVEDGVLTVAMECAYAPYNWSQTDDSNGAVPIKDSNEFANGYDVMMAKKICEANGWELEIVRSDWDSLIPAVQAGTIDAVIAGQSMTPEREEQVDFAGPYLYATIVCLTLKDSELAEAKSLADLAGHSCTSQLSTIWLDTCLPQVENADIKPGKESAPAMLMALETGEVDFVCTDMPTAQAALQAYDDMVLLDFAEGEGFTVDEGDINIGVSLMKGNTVLKDAINSVLGGMTADDFNKIMDEAIAIQPANS